MSTIQPPTPPTPSPLPTTLSTQVSVSIANPPDLMSQLEPGTRMEARVLTTSQGRAEILTPLGRVNAEITLALKADQPLILQVPHRGSSGPFLLQILEIAGKPIQTGTAQPPAPTGLGTPAATNQPAPPAVTTTLSLTIGSTLTATLLGPSPGGKATVLPQINTSQGTLNAGQIAGQPASQSAVPGNIPGPPGALPVSTDRSTPQQIPGLSGPQGVSRGHAGSTPVSITTTPSPGTAQTAGNLPSGTQFSTTIQSLTPPQSRTLSVSLPPGGSSTSIFSTGQTITGTVINPGNHGSSIVHTPGGPLSIATAQPLPPGTEITFRISSQPVMPKPTQALPTNLHRDGMIMLQSWPSLDESMAALQTANPQIAENITMHVIPKANAQFTATTLFFLSALGGGNVKSWLGNNATRLLEKLRPDALRRLGDDFRLLGRSDEDTANPARANDWRGTLIPLHSEEGIQQIRFFTRQLSDENNEDNETARKGKRFLIDINLSQIGRFQLDGIIEKNEKRLDMIIRTRTKLPNTMRQDLMDIFTHTNEAVGLHGGMSFQATPDAFIDPKPDTMPQQPGIGIIV